MKWGNLGTALVGAVVSVATLFVQPAIAGSSNLIGELQQVADDYVAQRGSIEKITGVGLHIDLNDHDQTSIYSGTYSTTNARPFGPHTLFEIGSNTKHFTTALLLKLEAKGVLNIDQTVGDWLPQYPDWAAVKIRSLLNMTSDIPNYSETVSISETMATDMSHQYRLSDLAGAVYGKDLPVATGWFYSNTNTILAAMIVEAASGKRYKRALESMVLRPLRLHNTYYFDGAYPRRVQSRLPSGIYDNPECALYQPQPCTTSVLQPLIGQDVSHMNMSWAGPAGAIASDLVDLDSWIRDLFDLKVVPKAQLDEMTSLVSLKSGKPIADVSAEDPSGFGLGLGRKYQPDNGSFWFYEGQTLGFRTIFAYWPQYDLVITASANSQPSPADNRLAPDVIVKALDVLKSHGLIASHRHGAEYR